MFFKLFFLFYSVTVPFYKNREKERLEKEIEYKQIYAELLEQQKAAERELLEKNK